MVRIGLWAVVFLVLLRLTIGWQFLMEGLQKVRGNYLVGETVTNRPFSSEGYFRNSTGPFSALIQGQLDNPDERIVAYLTAQGDKSSPTVPPADRMPVALGKVWDDYLNAFLAHYRPDAKSLERAQQAVLQAKAEYVDWLDRGEKEVTRKVGNTEAKMTLSTRYRLDEFRKALAEVREYDKKRWLLFRDVDKDDHAAARAKAAELRTALFKDVDEQTDKMRQGLARVVRQKMDDALVLPALPADLEKELPTLLTLAPNGGLPTALDQQWKAYFDALLTNLKIEDVKQKQVGEKLLDRARTQTVSWLVDADVQGPRATALFGHVATAEPAQAFQLAATALAWNHNPPGPPDRIALLATASNLPPKEVEELRRSLAADLKGQTDRMKAGLEEMLTEPQKSVTIPKSPEAATFIKTLDLVTICVITGAGAMLLIGLFTRLACVLAAGFLLLTFLSAPPFPWLPLPPATEGNPIYVNKNLIEFMALLALAGTASGRWLGIDGLLHWMFGRKEDEPTPATEPTTTTEPAAAPTPQVPVVRVKQPPKK